MRFHPGPPEAIGTELVYGDLDFSVPDGGRGVPYVAVNMVSTLDGRVAVDGKAGPIGSEIDRRIMRNIRCAVDAVVVGAGTARAEEMGLGVPEELSEKREARGLAAQPLAVVLAGSGRLPLDRKIFRRVDLPVPIVIAGGSTPKDTLEEASALGVRILRAEGEGLPDPARVIRLLWETLGIGTVLLEGGPAVNGAFLAAGMVDELFLTLSPKISLSRGAPSIATAPPNANHRNPSRAFDLASVHSSIREGELYLRYRRSAPPTRTPRPSFR